MANPFFQFKQFTVWHDKCAMKVGTDGVLLGAWVDVRNAQRIMDVGTGTGLVALMLAQRSLPDATIVALEIDEPAFMQAKNNVACSPWKDRMEVLLGDFLQFDSLGKFDVIVSNPPYFVDALTCADTQRKIARHNESLTYDRLFQRVTKLLSSKGEFSIIIPFDVIARVKEIAQTVGLYTIRQLDVVTKPGSEPKRALISFSFSCQEYTKNVLLTELSRHQYSEDYISLVKEYYLNL